MEESKQRRHWAWYEDICGWCGKDYSRLTPGATRDYCRPECKANAEFRDQNHQAEMNRNRKFARRQMKMKSHPQEPEKLGKREQSRKETLERYYEALPDCIFSITEAKAALGMNDNLTRKALESLVEAGLLRQTKSSKFTGRKVKICWSKFIK